MKKLLLIFTLALALSGCANGKSQEEENLNYALKPMVMVDDTLYLSTGRESTVDGRCGVMDGEITSSVAVTERPEENDQSNFGTDYGYQYGSFGTIEVLIDDKWIVFESEGTWGLSVTVEDITENGLKLKFTQSGGSPTGELETGTDYYIEYNNDGIWEEVEPVIDSYGWDSLAYKIKADGETTFDIDWEWLYGSLKEGQYRLVKSVMDFRDTGDFDEKLYYTIFVIE